MLAQLPKPTQDSHHAKLRIDSGRWSLYLYGKRNPRFQKVIDLDKAYSSKAFSTQRPHIIRAMIRFGYERTAAEFATFLQSDVDFQAQTRPGDTVARPNAPVPDLNDDPHRTLITAYMTDDMEHIRQHFERLTGPYRQVFGRTLLVYGFEHPDFRVFLRGIGMPAGVAALLPPEHTA